MNDTAATKPKTIQLSRNERIVAVVPECCGGPGWKNELINVHIVNTATNEYRCEFIEPEERTAEQNALFYAGSAMCDSLIASVRTEKSQMIYTKTMVNIAMPLLAKSETYTRLLSDSDNRLYHLILLPGDSDPAFWAPQLEWARSIGGDLPNRVEQAVLWARFRDQFRQSRYWSCEQYEKEPNFVWYQDFTDGDQSCYLKCGEFRARAVRRVYVEQEAA